MSAKLIISFSTLKDADFLAKSGAIIAALSANQNFPEPWPAPTPSLNQLNDVFSHFRDAYHEALDGAHSVIARRNHLRDDLNDQLVHLASYLEWVAHGNEDKLMTTGFDLRQPAGRGSTKGNSKKSAAATENP